jgi:energy-coupling factor transporter ATP-binding protein EcfA2
MSLHLTHLRVEQWRRFRQPFELMNLQPGLNIFTGPNEAGKSTLVRAIRAAFFERYRSKVVDDLRPWGDSGATPAVELGFELDGQAGLLSKSFLGSKARCDLRIGAQTWSGTDAEDHLAQLLGFAFAGKGASKAEHWGIPGLLWVEQGSGHELKEAADHAHEHLHQALHGHLRDRDAASLTATGGDAVLEAVGTQRDQLLTRTGRPTGALAEAMAKAESLRERCHDLQGKVQTYQQQVDELARLRAHHQLDEAERPWDRLQTQLEAARQALLVVDQAQEQLADARLQLTQLGQHQQLVMQQLEGLAQQERHAQQRQQQADQARAKLQEAEAALAQAQQGANLAQTALSEAQERQRGAHQAQQRQQLDQQHTQQARALAQGVSALQRAQQAEAHWQTLRQQALGDTTARLAVADMQRLRQLDSRAHQARLRMQGLATHIQFKLLPGQHITLQGDGQNQPLSGEGERLLLGETALLLPGLGELRIRPGGEDLSELAHQMQAAQEALQAALQSFDLPDLAQAETRHVQQAQQSQDILLAEQALALIAPHGVAALAAQHAQLGADLALTEQALQRLPAPASGTDASIGSGTQAPLSLQAAEAALNAAQKAQSRALEALAQAQAQRAAASAHAEGAEREWRSVQQQWQSPERASQLAQAQAQLLTAQAQAQAQQARVAHLASNVQQARPDILQQDVQRLDRSLVQSRQAHQDRRMQIAVVEQALVQQGAQGLEEALALSRGELNRAERRQQELQLRAEALELLRNRLEAKRQAALQRLQAPLQKHLQRYLGLLFAGASVAVSDTLVPTDLTRLKLGGGQEVGGFDALSFGAREQLALISRFAYADLLREAGRPTFIILDDALVHSDPERIAMMKRVVFDASQRHQVLLFSCHPQAWMDMGVQPRPISL